MSPEHPDLLPWLAAGKLSPTESRDIESHLGECEDCRGELQVWSALAGALQHHEAGHIAVEELTAYKTERRELDLDRCRWIEEHLTACPSCREDLELVGVLSAPAAESRRRLPAKAWAAAAAVVAAGLIGALWLRSASFVSGTPAVEVAGRLVLEPDYRSGQDAGFASTLAGTGPWVLSILLAETAPAGDYELSLVGPDPGSQPRPVMPVVADETRTITLVVRHLPPGDYVAQLRAPAGSIHVYRFRILPTLNDGR